MGSMPLTAQQQITQIANSAYYADIPLETAEQYSVQALLERSGYRFTTDGTAIYNGSIPSSSAVGSEVIGNTAVNTKIVTDPGTGTKTLKTSEIGAGTTQQGTGLLKGAMNVKVNPVMSSIMIAHALGYSINEVVYEHPEFWTDVSDALLGVDEDHPFGQVFTPQTLRLKNGLDVYLRARQDGGIGAYCEKQKIMAAVNRMYELGGFNTGEDLVPEITESGHYVLSPGGVSLSEALSVTGQPQPNAQVMATELANFNNFIQSHPANAMVISYYTNMWQGGGFVDVEVDCYNIPANSEMDVTVVGDNIRTAERIPGFVGSYQLQYDYYTGSHRQSGWTTAVPAAPNNLINGVNNVTHIKSTINTLHITPAGTLEPSTEPGTIVITDPSQLETLLADWMNDGFTTDRVNPQTGENEQVDWLPLNIFDFFNDPDQDVNQEDAQSGKVPGKDGNPSLFPDFLLDYLVPNINFPNFQFPEQPTGDTPLPFVPSNSMSSKLYTVYNPSNANLDSLGAFMWNTSIIQQLVELFTNNPMDAIISLHQIYATPSTGSNKNIILGVLDSNVPAPVVTNQYVTIDCGNVEISEIYGDARDYTQVQTDIFLPFIGLRSLDCHDVIGCRVGVKFKIDVYTGSTLAEISVTKQGVTQILYTFEGNCSVQIPLTAADRSRMIQGIVAATTGLVTGGVGAMAGAAAAASLGGAMQTSIQKSSAFSGNAGAMGGKIPYIVITRQKSADASNFPQLLGYPTNKGIYLKDCRGYVKVKDIHIDIARATDAEKDMLYSVLKNGIVI